MSDFNFDVRDQDLDALLSKFPSRGGRIAAAYARARKWVSLWSDPVAMEILKIDIDNYEKLMQEFLEVGVAQFGDERRIELKLCLARIEMVNSKFAAYKDLTRQVKQLPKNQGGG